METSATPDPYHVRSQASEGGGLGLFLGILLCFVLSGFAALIYQTAWMRQFSLVFGTSELAVAAVLAAYMAGLAAGAALAARFVERLRRPVLGYGLLELGIAAGALAVPVLLALAREMMVRWIGGKPELPGAEAGLRPVVYLAWAFLVILVPTTLMGATLPLLARGAVRSDEQVGRRIGWLYAFNTAGAVAGALVAAFHLLPNYGLSRTVWFGVGINAFVFVLAALLALADRGSATRLARIGEGSSSASAEEELAGGPRLAGLVLPLMLVSGLISFTYEVLWTRLLGHLLGGSLYSFAVMLASFLSGIALGSALAAPLARKRRHGALGLAICQIGIALTSISVYLYLDRLPELAQRLQSGDAGAMGGNATLAILVLLPATVFLGATFPFALRLLARDERDAARASARVYAWNTVGAISGAVLAGFYVIPALGYSGSIRFTAAGNLLLAFVAAALWCRRKRWLVYGSATLALLVLVLFRPDPPERLMRSSSMGGMEGTGRLVYQAVGRSASVIVLEREGAWELRCNGLPEAVVEPRGAAPFGRNTTWWLAALPLLARPSASSMLSIGFGGGVTLEMLPPSVQSCDVIELEPEVIEANRSLGKARALDPLSDERVHVFLGDARGALALTTKTYDVIVSQPSHPWTAGASHLYTRDFLQEAASHLVPEGVFVQWMLANFLDEDLLRSLVATLLDVFPHVRLYRPIPHMLVFLASEGPLDVERELARTGLPLSAAPEHWARVGIHGVNDALAMLAMEEPALRALAAGAPVNTDEFNHLATTRVQGSGRALDIDRLDMLLMPSDPVVDPKGPLATELAAQIDWPYLVTRMAELGLIARMQAVMEKLGDGLDQMLCASRLTAIGAGQLEGAAQIAGQALQRFARDPRSVEARFMAVQPFLRRAARDESLRQAVAPAASLTGPASAVVKGMRALELQEWTKLPPLEQSLSTARATDAWYWEAAALRAQLRVQGVGAEEAKHAGPEALAILDRALALHPDVECLLARLEVGRRADMPEVLVESVAELLRLLARHQMTLASSGQPYLHESQLALIGQALSSVEPALGLLEGDARVQPGRVREVLGVLRAGLGLTSPAQPSGS